VFPSILGMNLDRLEGKLKFINSFSRQSIFEQSYVLSDMGLCNLQRGKSRIIFQELLCITNVMPNGARPMPRDLQCQIEPM
jgi:hypothetical protein